MAQHELSNNPNRFAIRDPCGGYWGEGSKYGNYENFYFMYISIILFYFETFLSPDIPGPISVRRSTLLVMLNITIPTTNLYLICKIL